MKALRVAITTLIWAAALLPSALPAGQISYQAEMQGGGPPTPGPTDPNAPSA
jgi:hypothetical protein